MALCKHRNGEGIREEVGLVDIKLKMIYPHGKLLSGKRIN